jgi:hypothetical protein
MCVWGCAGQGAEAMRGEGYVVSMPGEGGERGRRKQGNGDTGGKAGF